MNAKRQGANPYDDLYREAGLRPVRAPGILIGAAVAVVR